MKTRIFVLLLAAASLVAQTPSKALLVFQERSDAVIVDPVTLKVIAKMPSGRTLTRSRPQPMDAWRTSRIMAAGVQHDHAR